MIWAKSRTGFCAIVAAIGVACAQSSGAPSGYQSSQLYNLGNAYARAGQPGLAVLSYERARLLAPGDTDIEINLRRVREAAHVSPETPSALQWLRLPRPYLVASLLLAGVWVLGLGGIAWRRGFRPPKLYASAATCGALMLAAAVCNAALVWPKLHSAVVIAAQAPVRAAPAPPGDPLFVLAEAETVNVTAQHEDFVLVTTLLGKTGWIPRAAVATIVPRK